METVINYIGSRYGKIFNEVAELVKTDELYIEPFGGGFSLGLNLIEQGLISKAIYNDKDIEVYLFWKYIKQSPFELQCEVYKQYKDKSYYEEKQSELEIAASKYLKNLFQLNSKDKNRKIDMCYYSDTFIKASKLMQNVEVLNCDYNELKKYDSNKTFWSCDPPFDVKNVKSYYRLGEFNHKEFSDFVRGLSGRTVVSYNASSELVFELYKNCCFDIIPYRNALSNQVDYEVLFKLNFEQEAIAI